MPHVNCCVPNCVATSRRTPSLSFYQLPTNTTKRKRWVGLIRNKNLRVDSKWTSVCSLHFVGGTKTYINCDPVIFPWSSQWPGVINEYNRKLNQSQSVTTKPLPLNIPKHSAAEHAFALLSKPPTKRRRVLFQGDLDTCSTTPDKTGESNAPTDGVAVFFEDADQVQEEPPVVSEPPEVGAGDGNDLVGSVSLRLPDDPDIPYSENMERDHSMKVLDRSYFPGTNLPLNDELQKLLDDIASVLNNGPGDAESLKKLLLVVLQLLKNVKESLGIVTRLRDWDRFLLRRFAGSDEDIKFWTGFYSYDALMAFYKNLLQPKVGEIQYWGSGNADDRDGNQCKSGPKRSLQPIDEMFLTLVKLKQGSANADLGERFRISGSHVSRIFTTWIKFMNCVLSAIDPWMSRRKIQKFMPPCFKELYKDIRVIIDCTEIPLQRPSDFECQSATYSTYKHCNTLKGLVGISPSGVPTFVSDLFEGSISDNQITFESGLLKLCQQGDAVMADRGFTCREAMAKQGVRLLIPHFLSGNEQLDLLQITESVAIARVRIHVERAMGRIKQWHILSRTLPVTYWNCANEIFQVCTKLVLFWPPLIDMEDC